MNPLTVALPLGIGDCHWACTKLRALSAHCDGRPVHAYVNRSGNHDTVQYLALVPQIAEAHFSDRAPYDINADLPGGYLHPRWSSLEGSAGWRGFDYVLVPNGHLERGEPLATYLDGLATEYGYPLAIAKRDVGLARAMAAPGSVLLYPSGTGPNFGFHRDTWTRGDWAQVVQLLNAAGVRPVLVGAPTVDDRRYAARVRQCLGGAQYVDLVGRTTVAQVMALIRDAAAWCGLNSGLGITAAMLGTPTVMLWADRRYPTGAAVAFDPQMQTSWLDTDRLASYRTLSFGAPTLTPESVVAAVLDVRRACSEAAA